MSVTDAVAISLKKARRRAWPPGSGAATVIAAILAVNLWAIAAVTVQAPPLVWSVLSIAVIHRAWRVWSGNAAMPLNGGTLVFASLLVSPHLFAYDASLLALAVLIARGLNGEDAQDFARWSAS